MFVAILSVRVLLVILGWMQRKAHAKEMRAAQTATDEAKTSEWRGAHARRRLRSTEKVCGIGTSLILFVTVATTYSTRVMMRVRAT